tara:strand:- start:556 stop:816 length:261 start_codon:yes stop_codon:yes gene_type:complete
MIGKNFSKNYRIEVNIIYFCNVSFMDFHIIRKINKNNNIKLLITGGTGTIGKEITKIAFKIFFKYNFINLDQALAHLSGKSYDNMA